MNRFLALSRASWCLQMLSIEWFLSGEHRMPSRHLESLLPCTVVSMAYRAQCAIVRLFLICAALDAYSGLLMFIFHVELLHYAILRAYMYAHRVPLYSFAWIISRNMPGNCLKTTIYNSLSDSASQYVHCTPSMSFYNTSWFFIFVLVLLPQFEHPRWR